MKKLIFVGFPVVVLSTIAMESRPSSATDNFETLLYYPIEITHSVTYRADTSGLNKNSKANLLEAKGVLIKFIKSLHDQNDDPIYYLNEGLRDTYKNRDELVRLEFDAEEILKIEVFDFNINEKIDEIQFRYLLTESTEGTTCEQQRAVSLKKTLTNWKLSNSTNSASEKDLGL